MLLKGRVIGLPPESARGTGGATCDLTGSSTHVLRGVRAILRRLALAKARIARPMARRWGRYSCVCESDEAPDKVAAYSTRGDEVVPSRHPPREPAKEWNTEETCTTMRVCRYLHGVRRSGPFGSRAGCDHPSRAAGGQACSAPHWRDK